MLNQIGARLSNARRTDKSRGRYVIVIFGGDGFLGRHIVTRAEAERVPVTVVSRTHDKAFFAHWAPSAAQMSVDDFSVGVGTELIRSAQAFIFLAGRSYSSSNIAAPWRDTTDNVPEAFQILLRVAEANPRLRIVFPSSGGTVYGEGHDSPIPETAPVAPICSYGLSKVLIEQTLSYVSRRTGVDYAILRISNPVGRWHRNQAQGLVEISIQKALAGKTVPVFGDGSNVRDYFDADELAEAFLTVARTRGPLEAVLNIGSGRGTSVLQVIRAVGERLGQPVRFELASKRPWDVSYSVLDPRKAARDLDWRARLGLEQIIDKLITVLA